MKTNKLGESKFCEDIDTIESRELPCPGGWTRLELSQWLRPRFRISAAQNRFVGDWWLVFGLELRG